MFIEPGQKNRFVFTENIINETKLKISESGHCVLGENKEWIMPPIPFARLYYHINGEVEICFGERFVSLKKNRVYLLPPGKAYPSAYKIGLELLYFHVNLYNFKRYDLLNGCEYYDGIPVNNMQDLLNMYYSNYMSDLLSLKSIILSDCVKFLRESENQDGRKIINENYSETTRKIIKCVRENLSLKLTTANIADNLCLPAKTLDYYFKKDTGETIGRYVRELVYREAEELLIRSELSIREISEILGFCDQFHFSRKFKDRKQKSPLEYRMEYRRTMEASIWL